MITPIKVIPTEYNGYHFRSRLEARWAIFFDTSKIKYEYEPQGFNLGKGIYYLPDFYLPELNIWVEIKGEEPNKEDKLKITELVKQTQKRLYLLIGGIPSTEEIKNQDIMPIMYSPIPNNDECGNDFPYFFCECPHCKKIGIEFEGRSERIKCNCSKDNKRTMDSPRLLCAYNIARGLRF